MHVFCSAGRHVAGPRQGVRPKQRQQHAVEYPSSRLDTVEEMPPGAARHSRPAAVKRPAHKPEVLAPAGGWPQLRAAVENGADAVYFGVGELNARARAANFTDDELKASGGGRGMAVRPCITCVLPCHLNKSSHNRMCWSMCTAGLSKHTLS